MLGKLSPPPPTELDRRAFEAYVPQDHCLRKALQVIPWDDFNEILASFYSPDQGRPSEPPVLLLKCEYLRYHYNLSDRQVIERARTDIAFRFFLQVDLYHLLPDPSSLCLFRGRLGQDGFRKVFGQIVTVGRQHGLVKDRLRIKDASHVIADIAVPTTLALVAQARDRLLATAEPWEPVRVEGERVNVELLRAANVSRSNEERLLARVTHLRDILAWVDALSPPEDAATNLGWQNLQRALAVAHKILADQEDPKAGDRIRSTVDPEARCSKHGDWYDGYLLDLTMDADSELITATNVLAANGDEATDAADLVRQEETAHGNDIQALSIDGAGFHGPLLRELEDADGLAVNTFVPPPKEPETGIFTPAEFVADESQGHVTCPAGQTSSYRQREQRDRSWIYRFKRTTCEGCPLVPRCMQHSPHGTFGKTVRKSDYEAEYRRARQKAKTTQYAAIRREHPKIERKLGEVMNCHSGRRAHYRGRKKVLIQELMACTATNIKRLIRLLCVPQMMLVHAR